MGDDGMLEERLAAFAERFLVIPDVRERLAAVVGRRVRLEGLRDGEQIDAALVPGCVSRVWLVGEVAEGRCRYRTAGEAQIVGGLASALAEVCDGVGSAEVAGGEIDLVERLGFDRLLSPTRLSGLERVRGTIRVIAEAGR
jgi:cysteine desulfuration protein SufE